VRRRDFLYCSHAATTVLSFTYGHDIQSQDHPLIKLVQGLTDILVKETTPEKATLLQTFPFSKLHTTFVSCHRILTERQNSPVSAFLVSWPWLQGMRYHQQATG
jgi:hypothetical protein